MIVNAPAASGVAAREPTSLIVVGTLQNTEAGPPATLGGTHKTRSTPAVIMPRMHLIAPSQDRAVGYAVRSPARHRPPPSHTPYPGLAGAVPPRLTPRRRALCCGCKHRSRA